jgi:hypothetical protein
MIMFSFISINEFDNSSKSDVYTDVYILSIIIYRIYTFKMAAAFGKGDKYSKSWELSV